MQTTRTFLEKMHLPSGDSYTLPDSEKRFPDGGQYRIEIPSVEGPKVLAAVIECADRGETQQLFERATGFDGQDQWRLADGDPSINPDAYRQRLDRRRQSDPDLWIVELDIADAARFAAETIGMA